MSENNNMFLYTVKPRKVIVGLSGGVAVRTNKSLYLTKEDVFLCLKHATVYRRFANEGIIERVTIDDVERVHRDFYISPEDWKNYKINKEVKEVHATVTVPETPEIYETSGYIAEVVEEEKPDTTVTVTALEETVEEPIQPVVDVVEQVVEEVVESDDEEEVEKVELNEE